MARKAAIVANSCWNIYQFRLNIIEKFRDEGWELYVIAPVDEFIRYREKFPGLKHIPLKRLSRKGTNPIKDLALLIELISIYRKLRPDLIIHYTHKPNIFGGFAAGLLGLPSAAVITGLGYAFLHKGVINSVTQFLYSLASRIHKIIVFENEDDKRLFTKLNLSSEEKSHAINGCGVDVHHYSPSKNDVISREGLRFCFVGRLLYDKGIREFVEAAKSLKSKGLDCEFIVIGSLDQGNPSKIKRQDLIDWVEQGILKYYGFLEDPRDLLKSISCVVVPSYREGMSRAVLEAMSMEIPVITSNVPGCRQAVKDGVNGFLIEPGNAKSLEEAMETFALMDCEKRRLMGEKGRLIAIEKFNSEKIADELYQMLSQAYFSD